MSCKISREQLWSWIDREAPELEEHLAVCPHCRARAGEIRAEIGLFAPDESAHQAPLPKRIGPYKIRRLLGEGGQAFVYEAEQPDLGRSVAVKVLKGGRFVSKRHIKHFRREAHALASLKHHGIATVYAAGRTAEGQHYFAMELVSGTPMDEFIREQRPTRTDRLRLLEKVCEAVSYAHHAGVIHRDLKPGNIMIDDDGNPKILDFGLARLTDTDLTLAATVAESGLVEGTPRYMSPEQVRGRSDEIDARSDVYALGVILYELLTDQPPYQISTMTPEALRLICEEPPSKPSGIDTALRGDLDTVILKALEKHPSRRYQTVEELAEDIRRYLDGEPILAKSAGRFYVFGKTLIKHRVLTASILAAAMLAVVGILEILEPPYDRARARQELLQLRCDLFQNEQSDQLLAEAKRAPGRYPGLVEAVLIKAQAHEAERALGLAINLLRIELERDPDQWPCRVLLAEVPSHAEDLNPGEAAAWGGALEAQHSAESWYLRSFATFEQDLALQWAKEALRYDPHHVLALECVIRLSRNRGDLDVALDGVSRMLSMQYQVEFWMPYKAHLLLEMRRYPEALQYFTAAMDASPDNPFLYQRRAGVFRRLRQYERAVSDYSTAIDFTEEGEWRAWLYYHRGIPNWILGRREDAVADFRAASERTGRTTCADARLFFALHELGRAGEAEQALEAAHRNVWDDQWLQRILACLAGETTAGQLVDGVEPSNLKQLCEAYYYAGEVHLLHGKIDEALECFRGCVGTGVADDPDFPAEPMSEYELAVWRLNQLGGDSPAVEKTPPR